MEDFWFIAAVRSEDEVEICAGQSAGRTSIEGHSAPNTPALFARRKDPYRAGGVAGRGEHLRAVPSRGHRGRSKEFLEAGKRRLAGDTARSATSGEVKDLRQEAAALKEVLADLTLANRLLKKASTGMGRTRREIPCIREGQDRANIITYASLFATGRANGSCDAADRKRRKERHGTEHVGRGA
jgi:transposase